jgi:hypothetical protein
MPRPRVLAFALVALVALVLLPSVGATAGATHTRTHIYEPFTAAGAPAKHVAKTVRGSCWEGSSAAFRSDAWRCMSGNFIYDPCFSSAHAAGIVLCSSAPWSASVVKMKLAKQLPRSMGNPHGASTKVLPWAVETTAGKKCAVVSGATKAIGNRRANYVCGHSKQWLWGSPMRKSEPWRIFAAPIQANKLTRTVGISTAWF